MVSALRQRILVQPLILALWMGYAMAQTMPPIIKRAQERGERIGEERGERRAKRNALLKYLEQHFGDVPDTLQTDIEAVEDLTTLDRLFDSALRSTSLEEFTVSMA